MRRSENENYRRGLGQNYRSRGNDESWGEYGRGQRGFEGSERGRGGLEKFGRRLGESARNIFGGRDYEYGERGSQRSTERRFGGGQQGSPYEGGFGRGSDLGRDDVNRDFGRRDFGRRGEDKSFGERARNFFGKGPKGWRRSDERIREDACECLYRSRDVDASNIEVSVEAGTVILKGTVDDRETKREAERAIENLSGVDDVRNELRVRREMESNISSGIGQQSKQGQQDQNRPTSLS